MPILVGTPYALSQSMKAMGFSPLGKLTRSPSRKRNGKGDPPRQTNGTSPAMVFRVIFLILLSTLGVILVIALTHSDKDVRLAIDGLWSKALEIVLAFLAGVGLANGKWRS